MRLVDLEPVFVSWTGHSCLHRPSIQGAQGLRFNCPYPGHGHWIIVWFANPVGVPAAPPSVKPAPRWQRSGDTFDTLTLAPSIDCDLTPGQPDFHGFIINGEIK